MKPPFTIWVITEGIAGTENQCLGVAEALVLKYGGTIVTKRVNLCFPYRLWSPFLSWGEGPRMLTPGSDPVMPPWPDVVIAGGRKAIGIARHIRRASAGRTFICVAQHPKVSFDDFDLVAMPVHDSTCHPDHKVEDPGSSATPTPGMTILTHGAPNRITPALLDAAREKWRTVLEPLPAPRTAVLIGGNSKHHRLGSATMDHLIAHLKSVQAARGGSLMITVSRRTPEDLRERLAAAFPSPLVGEGGERSEPGEGINNAKTPHPPSAIALGPSLSHTPTYTSPFKGEVGGGQGRGVYLFTGTGDNPYHGFLTFADYMICTTDSTSMISDAATTGKPIEFFPLPGGSRRHDRFMDHCRELGVGVPGATYAPWNDAERVAEVIEKMLKERPNCHPDERRGPDQ